MGFLITVEAPDASGKATQTKMLLDRLTAEGYKTYKFAFPNYGSDACRPVEMYLDGVLGKKPEDTNAYSASVLFAVDRFATVKNTAKDVFDYG
jgi:dTMP kinase